MSSASPRSLLKKTVAVLIPSVFAQAFGNVFLSTAMKEMGSGNWLTLLPRAAGDPFLWLGMALLAVSFVLFAAALSWADLSFVIPAVSLEGAVNVLFAVYFLHETVSFTRWAGVFLVSLGIILVVRSERAKSRPERAKAFEIE